MPSVTRRQIVAAVNATTTSLIDDDRIVDARIQDVGHEAGADALDAVMARRSAVQHG